MPQCNVVLTPRDGLFLNTGRAWFSGAAGRAETVEWPYPSTLEGAVRTLTGRSAEQADGKRFQKNDWLSLAKDVTLGASVALRRVPGTGLSPAQRMWRSPADSVAFRGDTSFTRLLPSALPSNVMGAEANAAVDGLQFPMTTRSEKTVRAAHWWTEDQFVAWLCGAAVSTENATDLPRRFEGHTAIDAATGTAAESQLFSMEIVELLDGMGREWCVAAQVSSGSVHVPQNGSVVLGGNGKVARVEAAPASLFDFPVALQTACNRGVDSLRLVTVAPAAFRGGWLPDGFEATADGAIVGRLAPLDVDVTLCGACIPRADGVSGWDVAHGRPKPTVRLVSPGAVYFVRRRDGATFAPTDVKSLWLAAWGGRTEDGFGRYVAGLW